MNSDTTRNNIITQIRQNLTQIQPAHIENLNEIQQWLIFRKTDFPKKPSEDAIALTKKIYGANYRCISDQQEFQYSNNLKALSLILGQIVFQDDYTSQMVISQLVNSIQSIKKIKNFPLAYLCSPQNYPAIIRHSMIQICDIAEENTDISIRDILSAYSLGLELFSLIIRSILIKLNYSAADDYANKQLLEKTPEIFSIICEYLDVNIIAKNASSKDNGSEVYLFTDYNLFIITAKSPEYICGQYFQNENQLKEAKQVNQSQIQVILGKSRRMDESSMKRSSISGALKTSDFFLDLGMSGSGFIVQNKDQQTPYFNSNAPTPEFGLGKESLKFRKSIEIPMNQTYFAIEEESENMEASTKRKQQQSKSHQNQKYSTLFKQNAASIIIDKSSIDEDEKTNSQLHKESKDKKPKSPPTLAGVAKLRFIKKKQELDSQQEQKFKPFKNLGELNLERLNSRQHQNSYMTPRQVLKLIEEPQNQRKGNKRYKGSFNEMGNFKSGLRTNKQSEMMRSQNVQQKPLDTFSKSPKLQKILSEIQIKRDHRITQSKNQSKSVSSKSNFNPRKCSDASCIINQHPTPTNNITQERPIKQELSSNVVNIVLREPTPKKIHCVTTVHSQKKFRKYSDNLLIKQFESIGSRSQNLNFNNNFGSILKKEPSSILKDHDSSIKRRNTDHHQKAREQIDGESRVQIKKVMNLGNLDFKKEVFAPDTCRSNQKKKQIFKESPKIHSPKNIGKFPQFLRNNKGFQREKKLTDSTNQEKIQQLKDPLKLLKLPENKRSSQETAFPILRNSPRNQHGASIKLEKFSNNINQNKNKNTQSNPILNYRQEGQNYSKVLANSTIPEQSDSHRQSKALDLHCLGSRPYWSFKTMMPSRTGDKKIENNFNSFVNYPPYNTPHINKAYDSSRKNQIENSMFKSNGSVSSPFFNAHEPSTYHIENPKSRKPDPRTTANHPFLFQQKY